MQYLLELRFATAAGFELFAVLNCFHIATHALRGHEPAILCATDHEAAHLADVSDGVESPRVKYY